MIYGLSNIAHLAQTHNTLLLELTLHPWDISNLSSPQISFNIVRTLRRQVRTLVLGYNNLMLLQT